MPDSAANAAPHKKLSVLFFGATPPPYHGASVMHETLLNSRFADAFQVFAVRANFATGIDDLGSLNLRKVLLLFKYTWQVFWILLTRRVDLVLFPPNFTAAPMLRDIVALLPVKLFGTPTVFYTHANHLPTFRQAASPLMRRLIDFTMRTADAAILVGENLKFNYTGYLPPERLVSVHHGIALFTTPPPLTAHLDKPVKVLYLSNLIVSKGFFKVLESMPAVVKAFPNVRFIFAGAWDKDADRIDAERFVRSHQLEEFIEWRGRVIGEAKERTLYEADIFVFPTFYHLETFGIVNLEAMQAGLPIITTGRAAIPEVVADGINGFIVPEQDSLALSEKILTLCHSPALRAAMRQANLDTFSSFYTQAHYADRMIAAVETLYHRITAR